MATSTDSDPYLGVRKHQDSVRLEVRFAMTALSVNNFTLVLGKLGKVTAEWRFAEMLEVARVAQLSPSQTSSFMVEVAASQPDVWLEPAEGGSFAIGVLVPGWTMAEPFTRRFRRTADTDPGTIAQTKAIGTVLTRLRRDRLDRLQKLFDDELRFTGSLSIHVRGAKKRTTSNVKQVPRQSLAGRP